MAGEQCLLFYRMMKLLEVCYCMVGTVAVVGGGGVDEFAAAAADSTFQHLPVSS